MSNISRRDFLKTAGVMTLAVAAAGVLAGCEGNAAPEAPVTGNKKLGDVVTIGDFEFSVAQAKQLQAPTTYNPSTGEAESAKQRELCLVYTVKNTGKKEGPFGWKNLTVYINGKKAAQGDVETDPVKNFGEATTFLNDQGKQTALNANSKNAVRFLDQFVVPTTNYGDVNAEKQEYVDITSIQVVYHDAKNNVHVVYDIETPAVEARK